MVQVIFMSERAETSDYPTLVPPGALQRRACASPRGREGFDAGPSLVRGASLRELTRARGTAIKKATKG